MFYLFTYRFGRRRHSEFPNCGLGWAGGVEGEGRGRFRVGVEGGGEGRASFRVGFRVGARVGAGF